MDAHLRICCWYCIGECILLNDPEFPPYFARLWLAETAFTGVYLRMSTPLTAICGVFGVSIFSYANLTSAERVKMQ